jgi:hypothetical protein
MDGNTAVDGTAADLVAAGQGSRGTSSREVIPGSVKPGFGVSHGDPPLGGMIDGANRELQTHAQMGDAQALVSDVDGSGCGRNITASASGPSTSASAHAAEKAKVIDFIPHSSQIPASELYRPEAPNEPIRAASKKMSYSDAVRFRPRAVNARPKARPQWRTANHAPRVRRTYKALDLKQLHREGRLEQPAGYKNSFTGRCFRCLAKDHKLADCRDPLCCLVCRVPTSRPPCSELSGEEGAAVHPHQAALP